MRIAILAEFPLSALTSRAMGRGGGQGCTVAPEGLRTVADQGRDAHREGQPLRLWKGPFLFRGQHPEAGPLER